MSPGSLPARRSNAEIAATLEQVAELLATQEASPYRVAAYRRAAAAVAALPCDVGLLMVGDGAALSRALDGVDGAIMSMIRELVRTGRLGLLDRLRGALDPVALLQTVPGIGPAMARRIWSELGIDSLEALEVAAWDGRLGRVPGVGQRRLQGLRAAVATMLMRAPAHQPRASAEVEPDVVTLLDVDQEYRRRAAAGELRLVASRRADPGGPGWLPILHTQRDRWQVTAIYSNSERALRLGRNEDWVVLYFSDDHQPERQRTVVTEMDGALVGRRVVRGREGECLRQALADRARRLPPPGETADLFAGR